MTSKLLSAVLLLCVPTYAHSQGGALTPDPECGITKGCFSNCMTDCNYEVTWQNGDTYVDFTMRYALSSSTPQWIALGFSTDERMGGDFVTDCIMQGSNAVLVSRSQNTGRSNSPLASPQVGITSPTGSVVNNILSCSYRSQKIVGQAGVENLNTPYVLFFGSGFTTGTSPNIRKSMHSTIPQISPGPVSMQSVENVGGVTVSNTLVKVHGCLMIAAWVLFASIGVVLARYYKPVWAEKKLIGEKVWFQFHRLLMILAAVCVITAFVIIFVHAEGWKDITGPDVSNFQKAHPYLGVIVTALTIINPVMALFRPHPGDKYRPVFNWGHWIVGTCAHILGILTIFIGVTLQLASTPFEVVYVLAAYAGYQFLIELILEFYDCFIGRNKGGRQSNYEMQDMSESKSQEATSKDESFKRIVIGLHTVIILGFATAVIIMVAIN